MKMEALQLYKCPKLGPALCSLTHASHSDNLFYSFMGALHAGSEGFAVLWVTSMQIQRAEWEIYSGSIPSNVGGGITRFPPL